MTTKIRGVLFDKDGTLFDLDATWVPAYRAGARWLAERAGRPDLAARLLADGGLDGDHIRPGSMLAHASNGEIIATWRRAAGGAGTDEAVHEIFGRYATIAQPVCDNLVAILNTLRDRNVRLGVATMDGTKAAKAQLAQLDLMDHFDMIAGFDAGFGRKPDKSVVHAFSSITGIEAAAIAVVGDNVVDLELGRAAECGLVVGVLSGPTTLESLSPLADVVLSSVAELPGLLSDRD